MNRDIYIDVNITGTNIDNFNPSDYYWGQWGDTLRCKQEDGQWTVRFLQGSRNQDVILTKLSESFPELSFDAYYWGCGEGFAGEVTYQAGICTKDLEFVGDEYEAYFAANYSPRQAMPEEVATC